MGRVHLWSDYPEAQAYKLVKNNVAMISDQWIRGIN